MLLKDVYKLGRAGDVKKVADGYGRNFLLPQGFAVLATPGALKRVESIRAAAEKRRAILNEEMSSVAEVIKNVRVSFAVKAGDNGKMYGSITTQDVVEAVKAACGVELKKQQIELQPIRQIGEYKAQVRLTMDLIPEIDVITYKEGDADPLTVVAEETTEQPVVETAAETVVEPEAEQE